LWSGNRNDVPAAGPDNRVLGLSWSGRIGSWTPGSEVLSRLAGLSGSDFTSLMLEVARRRAAAQTPARVIRRYRSDRFARPSDTPWWDPD